MNILVTGGAGFIGSNFVRYWLEKYPKDRVTNVDLLSYATHPATLNEFKGFRNHRFVKGDIRNAPLMNRLMKGMDAVFHFAAETHVDRSILDPQVFLKTNILGTHTLLEAARLSKVPRFIAVSTDEVYGSIQKGSFKEDSPLEANSPYSASKASSDLLCRAYHTTFGFPVIITRCSNNYGPFQFPEKVVPLFVTNLIEGKKVPLYGKGLNVREWIYVLDHCTAIDAIFRKGKDGEAYNIGSGVELANLDLARAILKSFGRGEEWIERVKDRPGHDFRYSLDSSKVRKLGWKPQYDFKRGLEETIRWYRENRAWWGAVKGRQGYKSYLKKNYKKAS